MAPPIDGDQTQELVSKELPASQQLRRKDDQNKTQFRQRTAYYSMFSVAAITMGLFMQGRGDVGENISTIITWIVMGHVTVIWFVVGVKHMEVIAAIRNIGHSSEHPSTK